MGTLLFAFLVFVADSSRTKCWFSRNVMLVTKRKGIDSRKERGTCE